MIILRIRELNTEKEVGWMSCQFGSAGCGGGGGGGWQCARCSAHYAASTPPRYTSQVATAASAQPSLPVQGDVYRVNDSAEKVRGVATRFREGNGRLRTVWSHNDKAQANFLWGPCQSGNDFCCCVCGWPIIHDDEVNFPGEPVGTKEPRWGKSSPEHELYASKGYRYVGLYWSTQDPAKAGIPYNNNNDENYKNFLRKEMKWAHWYCNNVKNTVPVIKWEGIKPNRRLVPWIENIMWIINAVWRGVQRTKFSTRIRFIDDDGVNVLHNGRKYVNLIHYFVETKKNGLSSEQAKINWKNSRLQSYITRLTDLISNIVRCVGPLSRGENFEQKLRIILNERTENPYGEPNALTKWPPQGVAITPTPKEECCTLENIEFRNGQPDWNASREGEDRNDDDFEQLESDNESDDESDIDDNYGGKYIIPKDEAEWLIKDSEKDVISGPRRRPVVGVFGLGGPAGGGLGGALPFGAASAAAFAPAASAAPASGNMVVIGGNRGGGGGGGVTNERPTKGGLRPAPSQYKKNPDGTHSQIFPYDQRQRRRSRSREYNPIYKIGYDNGFKMHHRRPPIYNKNSYSNGYANGSSARIANLQVKGEQIKNPGKSCKRKQQKRKTRKNSK